MQLILLSGGSGTRLWPLSNDSRSKQFLRLLPAESGDRQSESMVQRVVGQIEASGLDATITIATNRQQQDPIQSQLGSRVQVVAEPERRDTFPAVCLACEYLSKEKHCDESETIVVMPCDQFTDSAYYAAVGQMAAVAVSGSAPLVAMGIPPAYPSSKYGYLLPSATEENPLSAPFLPVASFVEKPSEAEAARLIAEGAYWNAGVYAFRLGFMLRLAERYNSASTFGAVLEAYGRYPKTSFDYEVAEKTSGIAMLPFHGRWKDLGTWAALLAEIPTENIGNVLASGNNNTHVINELNIPVLCVGTRDLIVASSPDGILVSGKGASEDIGPLAERLHERPKYEERRWGEYQVIDHVAFPDGYRTLTKRLTLNPGCSISYQRHDHRDETWTFIDGSGELVLDGERRTVSRGDTVFIPAGQRHALRAHTALSFIEVQAGTILVEEDIHRYPLTW